jgi:hypothetical protein
MLKTKTIFTSEISLCYFENNNRNLGSRIQLFKIIRFLLKLIINLSNRLRKTINTAQSEIHMGKISADNCPENCTNKTDYKVMKNIFYNKIFELAQFFAQLSVRILPV